MTEDEIVKALREIADEIDREKFQGVCRNTRNVIALKRRFVLMTDHDDLNQFDYNVTL